ncbi:CHAP domain-containing protein [Nonomuraea sp. NPDC048916]|uniref:CHAP domain-containing protein n=1 Tax=Nonomuraea sp. NPDC048916 TaxID=3154232 RepID=UPI0033D5CBBF
MGYREKGGQHTKFGNWYADRVQDSQYRNAPWCDMFIAWAADKAGVADYVGQFAWTPSHAAWFIEKGAWSAKPEPGALVFFDWKGGKSYKGIDHVGIVERVSGDRIHTIEANVDRVWLKRKTRETDKVVGYGLPRVVKENLTLSEIRATEQPFAHAPYAPRAEAPQGSPFDVLGTPQALLAVMVLTTVVLSLRRTGHRRGTRRVAHRRFRWPWNAPSTPSAKPAKPVKPAEPVKPAASSPPDAPVRHPAPARSGRPATAARSRVPAGVGHGSEHRPPSTRRRPYEPKS